MPQRITNNALPPRHVLFVATWDETTGTDALPLTGRDGKFEFTILEVTRTDVTSDNEYLQEKAKGEFVSVRVKVDNIGDKAQSFDTSDQKLYVGSAEYTSDTSLDSYPYAPINPGLSTEVSVLFDVPVGAEPTAVKLHDSMFSSGVKLGLPV